MNIYFEAWTVAINNNQLKKKSSSTKNTRVSSDNMTCNLITDH